MKVVAIIPARMGSTRFPGKPLADMLGLPMIEHVRRRVALSPLIDETVVATCDQEIIDAVAAHGGRAVMTSSSHERCTDRVAEADLSSQGDIVINVQGDEPLVMPQMFDALIKPLVDEPDLPCTNLMSEIDNDEDFNSPNVVKVVSDLKGNAVYFSREPIPSKLKSEGMMFKKYKQLGIIAFRKSFLHTFTSLPQSPLERIESVDMMRALEHGYKIRMVPTSYRVVGVDTPADLENAIALMKNDSLFNSYK